MTQWEEEAHKRLQEADEKQRAADRCARDGAKARRELERLKKAVESSFEDLQRQVQQVNVACASRILHLYQWRLAACPACRVCCLSHCWVRFAQWAAAKRKMLRVE